MKLEDNLQTTSLATEGARLYGFPRDMVPDVWSTFAPWIQRGLEPGDDTLDLLEIYVKLLNQDMQLFGVVLKGDLAGAGVTTLERELETGLLSCWVYSFAGENLLPEMRQLEAQLSLWAKAQGCDVLRIAGRRGWIRALEGWTSVRYGGKNYLEKIL